MALQRLALATTRFTQTAEYALRAVTHMAMTKSGGPMRAADLSEAMGIPIHYLSKIMRRLVSAGLLESQKGHGGGFRFARDLSEIRLSWRRWTTRRSPRRACSDGANVVRRIRARCIRTGAL